ncbi:MAG TPA: hypothetical protein VMB46_00510 [Methanomassiliicoccales archaeon]|nr:hypothetical protein [Methanomassiliicoccales archaeon]
MDLREMVLLEHSNGDKEIRTESLVDITKASLDMPQEKSTWNDLIRPVATVAVGVALILLGLEVSLSARDVILGVAGPLVMLIGLLTVLAGIGFLVFSPGGLPVGPSDNANVLRTEHEVADKARSDALRMGSSRASSILVSRRKPGP